MVVRDSKNKLMSVLRWGLAVLVLLFAVFALRIPFFIYNLELDVLNSWQKMYTPPFKDSQVALVLWDENTAKSKNELFGRETLRSMHGFAINFLKQAKPRKVLFDISFNGGSDVNNPLSDQYMVDSLGGTDDVFSSTLVFLNDGKAGVGMDQQDAATQKALQRDVVTVDGIENFSQLRRYTYSGLVPPFKALIEGAPIHYYSAQGVDLTDTGMYQGADNSGVMQRWIPFTRYENLIFPHLVLGAVLDGERKLSLSPDGELKWKTGSVRLGPTQTPLMKWYGHNPAQGRRFFKEYSYWDIVTEGLNQSCRATPTLAECRKFSPHVTGISAKEFENKYVLIGVKIPNEDAHKGLYGPNYAGVYIVANQLENLLRDDFVRPAPLWLNLLSSLLFIALGVLCFFRVRSIVMSVTMLTALCLAAFSVMYQVYARLDIWLVYAHPMAFLMMFYAVGYTVRYVRAEQLRQQLRFAFGKYVSPVVMSNLEKNPEEALGLKGQRREVTLLFCDIRGFTTFSENNPPEVVQQFLSPYFAIMNRIIRVDYQGTISKLMGDAIMAYWGFPVEKQDHAYLAVSAALAMKEALIAWQADPDKPPLNIGIGLNTGEVMIGNIGSEDFLDFTVIGDAVNLASRLEGLNKEFGTNIIISESTYLLVKDRVEVRSLGEVKVKGKEQAIRIYEPLALKEAVLTAPV